MIALLGHSMGGIVCKYPFDFLSYEQLIYIYIKTWIFSRRNNIEILQQ